MAVDKSFVVKNGGNGTTSSQSGGGSGATGGSIGDNGQGGGGGSGYQMLNYHLNHPIHLNHQRGMIVQLLLLESF